MNEINITRTESIVNPKLVLKHLAERTMSEELNLNQVILELAGVYGVAPKLSEADSGVTLLQTTASKVSIANNQPTCQEIVNELIGALKGRGIPISMAKRLLEVAAERLGDEEFK